MRDIFWGMGFGGWFWSDGCFVVVGGTGCVGGGVFTVRY